MFIEYLLVSLIVIPLAVIAYYKNAFSYWKRQNIPYITPTFPFGNLSNPFSAKRNLFFDAVDVYQKLKANGHKHGGFYLISSPVFMVMNPDHVKHVTTKDFNNFVNRSIHYSDKDDPLSDNLVALNDEKWKNLRSKLTPTFSSGKIKMMFSTMMDCVAPLIDELGKLSEMNQSIDTKRLFARYTVDSIGSCAFGIECNSFKDPDAELLKFGTSEFQFTLTTKLKRMAISVAPKLAKIFRLKKRDSNSNAFFIDVTKNTVEYRENNNISRLDFMQLLIQMKNGPEKLTLREITAQCYAFFLAGFESSSTLMTFCSYELAKNPETQDKLREEILANLKKYNGEITFDGLHEMPFLDQVINETLRKYPPIPLLFRRCATKYRFPNSDVTLEAGTSLFIPNLAMQNDPEYFPDPEKFIPERFSKENKSNIVPYTYLPFGEGPRNCIGIRFGLVQAKVGLVSVLKNFTVSPCEGTPENIRYETNGITLQSVDPIYLEIKSNKIYDV